MPTPNNHRLISVIIPTHNRANLLSRAVNSIFNQTSQDFEIIIVDDGSTDNTEDLVKEIIKKDKRISYFKQSQRGPSAARNLGVKKAQGDFITFLDDDDELLPNYLEEINRLKLYPDSVFVIFVSFLYSWPFFNKKSYLNSRQSLKYYEVGIGNASTVSKRIFTDFNIWFDENLYVHEDHDAGIRCLQNGIPVIFIDKPIFCYNVNIPWQHKSLSTLKGNKVYHSTKYFYEKHYQFFAKQGKKSLALLVFLMGRAAAKNGLMSESRSYFKKSYKLSWSFKCFIYWLMTLGGKHFFLFCYDFISRLVFIIRMLKCRQFNATDEKNN